MDNLRELHAELLDVLKQYQMICKKNALRYFPIDGTLLGLVRHAGFIPWDDDIDIGMPRKDFEKLAGILEGGLPQGMYSRYYKTMDSKAKDIQYGIRLYSRKAQLKTNFYDREEIEDINIDIFPIDGVPEGKIRYKLYKAQLLAIKAITKLSQVSNIRTFMKRPPLEDALIRIGKALHLDRILNTKKWYGRLDRTLQKYPYETAKVVGVFWSDYRFNEMVPKACYEPAQMLAFEDTEMPCPANPQKILQQLYGDWQHPPKEGAKQKHPITLYRSSENSRGGGQTNS